MSWFTDAAKVIEDDLSSFWKHLEPNLVADLEAFFSAFAQIALGAVLEQAPLVLSGSEKFGQAVVSVIQQAEAKGWQVAVPAAQQLVQHVYNAAALTAGQTLVVAPGNPGMISTGDLKVPPGS